MKPIARNKTIEIYAATIENLPTNQIGKTVVYSILDGYAICKGIDCTTCTFSIVYVDCMSLDHTIPIITNLFPELYETHPELFI